MQELNEDNVVFVLQKAFKHFKINVTYSTLKKELSSHPHYPSLNSISDVLKKWKIPNHSFKLTTKEIEIIEFPFIAHTPFLGGQFVFVENNNDGLVKYHESKNSVISEDFKDFSKKISGVVLIMEPTKDSGETNYIKNRQIEIINKSILPVCLIVISLLIFNQIRHSLFFNFIGDYYLLKLVIPTVIGIIASIFLVLHELKINNRLAEKICNFSSKIDCNLVLESKVSRLYGWINWADVGLIYFVGIFIFLFHIPNIQSIWVLSLISLIVLPYPLFSVYYQAVVLRRFCPFCLIVQVILIALFVLLLPVLKQPNISLFEVITMIKSFLVPLAIWISYKSFLLNLNEKDLTAQSLSSFKRNPLIFKSIFENCDYQKINKNSNSLIFGNQEAKITITAFLSLYCHPCANLFNELKQILEHSSEIKINIIFTIKNDNNYQKIIKTIYSLYTEQNNKAAFDYLIEWYTVPKLKHTTIANEEFQNFEFLKKENKQLLKKHNIKVTPTVFINGYKQPDEYKLEEIVLFNNEIQDLTKIQNIKS